MREHRRGERPQEEPGLDPHRQERHRPDTLRRAATLSPHRLRRE